jgi:hypothetical protein
LAAGAADAGGGGAVAGGIWRDRKDVADVAAHVRTLREPHYSRDGSRNEP